DFGFDLTRAMDEMRQLIHVELFEALKLAADALEQAAVANDAVLDGFVESGAQFAFGQSLERRRIDDDKRRLMECANEVLAVRLEPGAPQAALQPAAIELIHRRVADDDGTPRPLADRGAQPLTGFV